MRIGLLSDTHGYLDPAIFQHFECCEEVWHAGDIGSPALFDELRRFRPLRAVYGNIDGPDLRSEMPEYLEWDCASVRILMTHIGGYPRRWDRKARARIEQSRPGVFVCGHSHVLRVMRDEGLGVLYLNSGAAGRQGWHKVRTALRFSIEDGRVRDLEAVELGTR